MLQLLHPTLMPTTLKSRGQKGLHNLRRLTRLHMVRRQTQNVRIVMLPRQPRIRRIPNQSRPNLRKSIRRHTHPHPTPTKQNPKIRFPTQNIPTNRLRQIRIIHALLRKSPCIRHHIPLLRQMPMHRRLQPHSPVVRPQSNP